MEKAGFLLMMFELLRRILNLIGRMDLKLKKIGENFNGISQSVDCGRSSGDWRRFESDS
jgi:hypothetical protein